MRRIVPIASLVAVFSFTAFVAAQNAPQATSKAAPKAAPKVAAKTAKTQATPSFGNADAITEEEMRIYDYFLASDQMEGRNLPSRGLDTAALYVASHLAEWGLKPAGSTSGTNGPLQPYFGPMELVSKSVIAEESKASITAPGGRGGRGGRGGFAGGGGGGAAAAETPAGPQTTNFEYGKDWTVAAGGRGAAPLEAFEVSGNLVFAGNGYTIEKTKTNPYDGVDVKGKIVVVAGVPAELAAQQGGFGGRGGGRGGAGGGQQTAAGRGQAGGNAQAAGGAAAGAEAGAAPENIAGRGGAGGGAAGATNPLGENCKDYMTPEEAAAKNGALAVITVPNLTQLTALGGGGAAGAGAAGGGRGGAAAALNGPNFIVPALQAPAACPSVPAVTAGLTMTNSLFQGEKSAAAQALAAALANTKSDSFELNAERRSACRWRCVASRATQNVIGKIEGCDPVAEGRIRRHERASRPHRVQRAAARRPQRQQWRG